MGFTLTRTGGAASISHVRTPEQELNAKINHNHMTILSMNPPITEGSDKQIAWAKKIAAQFLFHAHAWGFKAEQINQVFESKGKHSQFWIDNRNPSGNSGEGKTRIAVENLLAEIAKDRAALAKSQKAIAQLTPQQINKAIGRGV